MSGFHRGYLCLTCLNLRRALLHLAVVVAVVLHGLLPYLLFQCSLSNGRSALGVLASQMTAAASCRVRVMVELELAQLPNSTRLAAFWKTVQVAAGAGEGGGLSRRHTVYEIWFSMKWNMAFSATG